MSFNRYDRKVDSTQGDIVKALRRAGVRVEIISRPVDLLTLYRGVWKPIEVEGTAKKRTRRDQEKQKAFIAQTGTPVVKTVLEALQAVGVPHELCEGSAYSGNGKAWDEPIRHCGVLHDVGTQG
jgi:hypothetical protein